jgi:hypothetical protein
VDDTPIPPFPARDAMSLIGATVDLFTRHLTAFAWTSIAPALAISLLDIMLSDQQIAVRIVLAVPLLLAELVIWAATTLVTAGAVLDHVPDVATAYRCALRSPLGTLLKATLLMILLIGGGTLLLIVPGMIVLAQTLLVPAIIIIERRQTWDSLRRSRALGAGFYVRNVLIIVVLYLPTLLASMAVGAMETDSAMADVLLAVLGTVLQTLTMIATVLLYIDMRARKERFDPTALALELNAAYGERS